MSVLKELFKKLKALFIFLIVPIFVFGCSQPQTVFYFSFGFDSYTMQVGEQINVFDLEINSNLQTYEHMHMFCENTEDDQKIVGVSGYNVTALQEGTVKITVAGFENGQYLHDYFYLTINVNQNGDDLNNNDTSNDENSNDNPSDNESENQEDTSSQTNEETNIYIGDYNYLEDDGEISYSFNVYKNGTLCQNISLKVIEEINCLVTNRRIFGGNVEITCNSTGQVLVEITDNPTQKSITIILPLRQD